jgi:hypothetical protein
VGVSVRRREETELLAGLKISALPASLKVVLPATIPDLALRWPTIVATPAFTPKLHHRPKSLVTGLIVGEWLEERGKPWSHPLKNDTRAASYANRAPNQQSLPSDLDSRRNEGHSMLSSLRRLHSCLEFHLLCLNSCASDP